MKRRYAFRYLKIDIIDTSQKFKVGFHGFNIDKVSAVSMDTVPLIQSSDQLLKKIDEASIRTLQNCMQTVFEDGPKRDRRLWLGDLYLQALVNYYTFKNYELVKRCLYLFAGMTKDDGMIAACLFTEPTPLMDDTFLLDYSLFFISTLLDYYKATNDMETLIELSPIALKQLEIAKKYMNEDNIICEEGPYHCFIDWNGNLNKQCAMQAIYIYALKDGIEICRYINNNEALDKFRVFFLLFNLLTHS